MKPQTSIEKKAENNIHLYTKTIREEKNHANEHYRE